MVVYLNSMAFSIEDVPRKLRLFCENITEDHYLPANKSDKGIVLEFVKDGRENSLEVLLEGNTARIIYDKPHHAARGLGALLAGLVVEGEPYREQMPFEKLGIMLDCSRNAVMKVSHIKKWMRQIALLGYNVVKLYMEDTYDLPGEPFFGYMRGRYSAEELKEIDCCAGELNIELIGCIQTLGHLEHLLKWPAYSNIKDTKAVMLVDNEETYRLIDKMISHFAECFTSRRIHIGMDETFDLGLGNFLEHNSYQHSSELYSRHLHKVVEICQKHDLHPMIWSDMYFRTGNVPFENYDSEIVIPPEVEKTIPSDVEFVFWDYYKNNEKYYLDLIERHRQLGKEPIMASGIWTWAEFWYNHEKTVRNATPCINASRRSGLKELFFTMWGDKGAYCEFDSAMAGIAYCAEKIYTDESFNEDKLAARFEKICNASYHTVIQASKMNHICNMDAYMWDDPLLGIEWKRRKKEDNDYWVKALAASCQLSESQASVATIFEPIDLAHAFNLVEFIKERIETSLLLEDAYRNREKQAMELVQKRIPSVISRIDELLVSLRRQWFKRNKPIGIEELQQRFGGLKERYIELGNRLDELLNGVVDSIYELEDDI